MMKTINGIEAKGRNGIFKANTIHIWDSDYSKKTFVEVYSKKLGKTAPIEFEGNRLDLILFFESIVNELKADKGR